MPSLAEIKEHASYIFSASIYYGTVPAILILGNF